LVEAASRDSGRGGHPAPRELYRGDRIARGEPHLYRQLLPTRHPGEGRGPFTAIGTSFRR